VYHKGATNDSKRFALTALTVWVVDRIVASFILISERHVSFLQGISLIPIKGALFDWILPFLIVYTVENRDMRSLGLVIEKKKYRAYALCAFLGLILPGLFVGVDQSLLTEFVEQVMYIGVAEELFYRGYLMTRLCEWQGERRGLLLNAVIFGSSHVISLVSQHGFKYPLSDALNGLQTFIGGLFLGYVYIRSRSIVPGSIFHVSMNAYMPRLMEILSG